MNRQVFENGVLVEEWDDEVATYTRFESGEEVESRPYTTVEQEQARREAREALLDATLELSVAA